MRIDPSRRSVSLDPSSPAFVQDPYATYAEIRAVAPAMFWEQYGFWCLFDHAGISAALRDRRLGRENPIPVVNAADVEPFYAVDRLNMLEREPPAHTRLRGLVNRAFVSRQVERLRPRIAALAHSLIDAFAADGDVDLLAAFATPVPVTVIAELLGVPLDEMDRLLDWSHRMVAMYRLHRTRADEESAVAATEDFVSFLRTLIAQRRAAPLDDLTSLLLEAHADQDRLSEDELIANIILLLNAGHEATVHAIGNGAKAVLESGLDPAAIFATAESTEAAVEEMLRLDTPLHLFTRYALEDCEIAGLRLRRGEQIGLVLGAANHDPAVHAEPHRFRLDRTPPLHASFGGGIHFCLGAPLARLELQVALPILFARLPGLRLAARPRYADSYHFRGLEGLVVAWPRST